MRIETPNHYFAAQNNVAGNACSRECLCKEIIYRQCLFRERTSREFLDGLNTEDKSQKRLHEGESMENEQNKRQ